MQKLPFRPRSPSKTRRGGVHQDDAVFEWVAAHFLRPLAVFTGIRLWVISEMNGRTFYPEDISSLRDLIEPHSESICATMLIALRDRARKSGSLESCVCASGFKFFSVPILTGSAVAGFIEGNAVFAAVLDPKEAKPLSCQCFGNQKPADREGLRNGHFPISILSSIKLAVAIQFIRLGAKRVAVEIESKRKPHRGMNR